MKLVTLPALIIFFLVVSCKTMSPNAAANSEDAEKVITLKYPVVLVHGVAAHDRGGIINFWGRIPQRLQDAGVKVFFGNTDSWGDFESNAKILRETIDKILNETNSEKVNIIAHSKGGLDSRYFIWKYDYGDKVASLTTISTPHHGAELADLIYKHKFVHTRVAKKALLIYEKLIGDINPDLYNVNYQLTTGYMKGFNENVFMDDRVYYQSIYSSMKNSYDDLMFFYSHRYIKSVSGDNDGVVSEYSAKWGSNIIKIEGGISHVEIIDARMIKSSKVDIPGVYINVVTELSKNGF